MASSSRARLPCSHPTRLEFHDLKLWRREKRRALLQKQDRIKCPCTSCKGNKLILVANVERHLVKGGRDHRCRWWRDRAFEWDDSDEEWNGNFEAEINGLPIRTDSSMGLFEDSSPNLDKSPPIDVDSHGSVDIDVNRMLAEMFHDFDASRDSVDPGGESNEEREELYEDEGDELPESEEEKLMRVNEESLREACKPLYEGARMSTLAFVMMLLNICYQHRVPNVAIDEILALLKQKAFPAENQLPERHYNAKRLVSRLGLNYISIHACPKGCVLFRKEYQNFRLCPKCGASRYSGSGTYDQPVKVLRHFPVIPRLLRMYRAKSMSSLMNWSSQNKSTDGLVRHAADSEAWKHIDKEWPEFAAEGRNIRYALALDGVNPYSDKSTSWSTWPILLVNYNLPPWLQTKKFFLQLALLIPGKESITGDNLDTYLAPLIEELQQLWVGVTAFDASASLERQKFKLRAMIMWTINDYPALGTFSGLASKGLLSCVACGPRVTSEYSKVLHKPIFRGHRKWLPEGHAYRKKRYSHHFDNSRERDSAPARITPREILERAEAKARYDATGGRDDNPRNPYKLYGVKRRSVMFDLPYWELLLIRETIDVMHTEKNVADNMLKTLWGFEDKPKVRRDLQNRNIRKNLWMQPHPTRANTWVKPAAPWVLTQAEQKVFRARLSALVVPSGYCGRLKKHLLEKKIGHMKSHDFHVFMHQVLPVCLRGLMRPEVRSVILRLSRVFRKLCVKVWNPNDLPALKEEVAVTMVLLEMVFPPTFFNNMTHLVVHLVEEIGICGPVSCRWMYPIERYLSVMKRYVRNRARPEGCMAECYLQDEAVGFATEYMANFDPVRTRIWDDKEDGRVSSEQAEGVCRPFELTAELRDIAHNYIVLNMECMEPWVRKWKVAKRGGDRLARVSLTAWLQDIMINDSEASEDRMVRALSIPPRLKCRCYKRISAYGNHFRVRDSSTYKMKTFDSGIASIFLQPATRGGSRVCNISYVGILINIIQFNYGLGDEDPLLLQGSWVKPDWEGETASMMFDDSGFLLADFRQLLGESVDPFVFPSQVEQVFYTPHDLADPGGWAVVLRKEARSRRVYDNSVDMLRVENRIFEALEAPPVLPTDIPELSLEDGELFTSDDPLFRVDNSEAEDSRESSEPSSSSDGEDSEF